LEPAIVPTVTHTHKFTKCSNNTKDTLNFISSGTHLKNVESLTSSDSPVLAIEKHPAGIRAPKLQSDIQSKARDMKFMEYYPYTTHVYK
jgi:hypothetical protein